MSWFSRTLSMNAGRSSGAGGSEDEEDNAAEGETDRLNLASIASATGMSVKEDFSNLTKTFTRQLWGVASFLAPPPPPADKSSSPGKMASQQEEEVGGERDEEESMEKSSGANSAIGIEHQSRQASDCSTVQPESNSVEGTSRDGSVEESDVQSTFSPDQPSDQPRLTGLRSDFAELRGTMATGFSRISSSVIRVVAGDDDSDGDGGEEEDSPRGNVNPRTSSVAVDGDQQLQSPSRGFDTFLKPLFGNMLTRENSRKYERNPAPDEGTYGATAAEDSDDGESKTIELDSLPSAIASGIGGISKFASSFLRIVGEEDVDEEEDEADDGVEAVGVNEAVITFARNIAMHPETWLDFPLAEDGTEDDFKLTSAQKDHAQALEMAAPRLAALRNELCPTYMSEGRFWKIYFVLMHSRLNSSEAQILSTDQVVSARVSMLQGLQKREPRTDKFELDSTQKFDFYENIKPDTVGAHSPNSSRGEDQVASTSSALATLSVITADPVVDSSLQEISQSNAVHEADQTSRSTGEIGEVELRSEPDKGRFGMANMEDEAEVNEWLEEEPSVAHHVGSEPSQSLLCNTDEDVSFSDLEEDDSVQTGGGISETIESPNKTCGSTELNHGATTALVTSDVLNLSRSGDGTPTNSERAEFNDWLTVSQDDVA